VTDQSGQILAQGITGAAANIADTINLLGQRTRQAKAFRTMAVDGLGMDPDEVDKMSLPQLQGTMQGVALKNAQQQHAAQIMDIQSQAEERRNIGAYRQSLADKATADEGNMKNFGDLVAGRGGDLTPAQMIETMNEAGLNPDQQEKLSRAYQGVNAMEPGGGVAFSEDPVSGQRFAIKGKQVIPSGMNPEKAVIQAQDVVDQEGNPTGTQIIPHPNGKGFTVIKGPNAAQAGRLDQQTLQGYMGILHGQGNNPGLLSELTLADNMNAKAKADKSGKTLPYDPAQYAIVKSSIARIQSALQAHDQSANAQPAVAANPAVTTPPKITSQGEYDALKPGRAYYDENGKVRIKGK
jgi:hypothetical protein